MFWDFDFGLLCKKKSTFFLIIKKEEQLHEKESRNHRLISIRIVKRLLL